MFEVPTLDQPSGVVLEVVQHGYVLHDRLLRPAMVGVSKAGEPPSAERGPAKKRRLRLLRNKTILNLAARMVGRTDGKRVAAVALTNCVRACLPLAGRLYHYLL